MQIIPSECQLTIEWTLPICVKKIEPVTGPTFVHVHDLDAKLEVVYWEVEDRDFEWEVRSAEIDGITITKDTDKVMWSVVQRAVSFDFYKIHERVNDDIRNWSEAA